MLISRLLSPPHLLVLTIADDHTDWQDSCGCVCCQGHARSWEFGRIPGGLIALWEESGKNAYSFPRRRLPVFVDFSKAVVLLLAMKRCYRFEWVGQLTWGSSVESCSS